MNSLQPHEVQQSSLDTLISIGNIDDNSIFDDEWLAGSYLEPDISGIADSTAFLSELFANLDSDITCEKQNDPSSIKDETIDLQTQIEPLPDDGFSSISFGPEFNDLCNSIDWDLQHALSGSNNVENNFVTSDEDYIQDIIFNLKDGVVPPSEAPTAQSVVDAIYAGETPMVFWSCQPSASHRFRYATDGKRYLESSRKNPPTVQLPDLSNIELGENQSFGVQLTLVTTTDNPEHQQYLHEHKLLYNEDGAIQNGSSSVRVPLTRKDIQQKTKQLRKIQIIRKKHGQYTFQLVPHNPVDPNLSAEEYVQPSGKKITKAKKAKHFDGLYHTNQCRIICQLMFRDGGQWYTTELFCTTHVITDSS